MVTTEGIWTQSLEAEQILCQSYATGKVLVLGKTPAFYSVQARRSLYMPDSSSLARVAPFSSRNGSYRSDHGSDIVTGTLALAALNRFGRLAGGESKVCL